MNKRLRIILAIFFAFVISALPVYSQTHAEATSQLWRGLDVSTVLGNSAYDENVSDQTQGGYPILLYNIGTGCFMIQGGDWGIEGRLFHRDFGRVVRLYSSGRINSGVTESNVSDTKNSYGVNVPGVTKGNKNWSDVNKYCYTTIMDAPRTFGTDNPVLRHWDFDRVEDPSNTDTYTYYIHETISNKTYNLGGVYGEWHDAAGKGDGYFVYLDDDRTCWTTASVQGNTTHVTLENGDEVEIQKLYQWRLVTEAEYIVMLNSEEEGLNPSMSSLIPDRDFTRNSDDFYQNWVTDIKDGYTYSSTDKRYTYTYGNYLKGVNQQKRNPRLIQEAWDTPVKLKVNFDDSSKSLEDRKKNCKFGYMNFEGVGSVYTTFQVPKAGWYQVECAGFSQSSSNNDAYMFARVLSSTDAAAPEHTLSAFSGEGPHFGRIKVPNVASGTYQKDNYNNALSIGTELLYDRNDHVLKVWVLVSADDFNGGTNYIRVGFSKDAATKSSKTSNGYYDTDMVCIDDLRMTYMGIAPAFFYDTEESLEYLDVNSTRHDQVEYASSSADGRYGGATCIERSFTRSTAEGEDLWNTFSFPIPLTGEQIRYAFGDKTKMLKLNSIGNLTSNENIIDFETVNLVTLDHVIQPGVLYLISPENAGSTGENPKGEMSEYYSLGKFFFSTNPADASDPSYTHPVLDLTTLYGNQSYGSYLGQNDGVAYVSYCQTPGYSTWSVYKSGDNKGKYNGTANPPAGSYVPKGGYAMSGGKMYELNKDTRIKGFRGWLVLTHSIFQDSSLQGAIAINGIVDGSETTNIDPGTIVPFQPSQIKGIYDLTGRELNMTIDQLPSGIYIVEGKKMFVR